jgi:hypothetical protein
MSNDILADRLTNYADALVATTFILMTGLGAAVGDPDFRCELAGAAPKMALIVSFGGVGIILAIRWLSKWSEKLRDHTQESEETLSVQRKLNIVRHVLSIVFVLFAIGLVFTSLTDSGCVATI